MAVNENAEPTDSMASTPSTANGVERNEPPAHGSRTRGGTNISGVDILPIPPALNFPYPKQTATPQDDEHEPFETAIERPEAERQSSFPFFPPRKSSTMPLSKSKSRGKEATSPGTPNLLERIRSAPLRPTGPRKFGTERPRLFRKSTTQTGSVYDPEAWGSDYSESDDDEHASPSRRGNRSHAGANVLQRTTTTPLRRRKSDQFRRFAFGNEGYKTRGHVSKHDGRLNISLRETANKGYLAKALGASLQHHLAPAHHDHRHDDLQPHLSFLQQREQPDPQSQRPELTHTDTASTVSDLSIEDPLPVPKLNIVVMVIGSRGDIQPFLRLGKILKEQYGHRIRIATHPTFKKFVEEDAKLEFFNVGGDPAELMAFMVKNPGLIPKSETLRSGEIPRRRAQMFEMFQGFWRACTNSSDSEPDPSNRKLLESKYPFVADAIIANPPSFAHVHCAERLGIPLHLMFTFPNTPTQQFPHPLTNIRQTNVDANYTNFMSYPLVEMMQWQGLGDLINDFRVKTLGLEAMNMLWAPGQLFRQKVPYSYLWSPGLIPKPSDWGSEINITGFVFLDLASSFKPPDDLAKFLDAGEKPVYIGFGSIVIDDPDKFTQLIFKATKKAGVRALVNKGWGGLGGEDVPDHIFMLDNTPHDWLFPRVRAVVHHGGAGTTAIGLKCGKPTMIVPFFGDQPFWGAMVAKAGAGVEPVPYKQLSSDKLAECLKELLTDEKQQHAKELADKIEAEGDGAENAVKAFHKHLPRRGQHSFRCSILQDRVAAWSLKGTEVHLSPLAAYLLVRQKKISWNDLRLARVYEWNDFEGPGEPLTGMGTSLFGSLIETGTGVGKIPWHWIKIIRRKDAQAKHRRKARSQQLQKSVKSGDKEYKKIKKEDQKTEADEEKSSAASAQDQQKRDKSPCSRRQEESREKGGELGKESKLPGGNEPIDTNKHPSRFHMPHLRKKPLPDHRPSDDRTLVGDGSEDEETSDEDDGEVDVVIELAAETGRGFKKSGGALIKLPMNLLLALARGFHNAPRLYGDETVRTTRRITGFHSGLLAAGDEFVYGVWDGWSGVIRHPYTGAKYDGALGFIEGLGKGAGGFILKDLAAIFGVPAYAMKGVHKELTKYRQPTAFIRRTRQVEGDIRYRELTEEQCKFSHKHVADGWEIIHEIDLEIQKTIKEQGVRGRYRVWQRRQWLKEHGVIENIAGMQRALEAKRAGRDWEVEFRDELQRHQREQERAKQKRHDEKKKHHQRDENGRHYKTPDQRMKTQFRTHHALKKSAKQADKRWQDSHPLMRPQDLPVNTLQRASTDEPVTTNTRPRAVTHMASANDGVATADHGNDYGASPLPARDLIATPTMPGSGRSRENSGQTLVQKPVASLKDRTPTQQNSDKALERTASHPLNTLSKDFGDGENDHVNAMPNVSGRIVDGRGFLPSMVTA